MVEILEQVGRLLQGRTPYRPLTSGEIKDAALAALRNLGRTAGRGSVIPSDHCYNLTNSGLTADHVPLFECSDPSSSRGRFWFRGRDFPFDGTVYHRPLGGTPRPVASRLPAPPANPDAPNGAAVG